MFLYNTYLEVSGTIKYENQDAVASGLKTYNSPTFISTGAWFVIADRKEKVSMGKDSNREYDEVMITQFGHDQIKNLLDTGISFEAGRMQLEYNGDNFRATNVNTFGIPYTREYRPVGLIEVTFKRKVGYVD